MAAASAAMFGTLLHGSRWSCTFAIALSVGSSRLPRLVSRSLSGETHAEYYKVILRSGHAKRPPGTRWNVPSAAGADRDCGTKALVTSKR